MYSFRWQELLVYILPIVMVIVIRRFVRPRLRWLYCEHRIRLNEAILLLPTWIVVSDLLGQLLYGMRVFPIWVFVSAIVLGVHLYDYVRVIKNFYYGPYFFEALSKLSIWSFFLMVGVIVARIYSYFI